jgi:thioredoxin reductase (NADPH)
MHDVIIAGAGPSGLSTALQLKRYGINPLLIEKDRIGGLLYNANLVENYPGFPGGIPGPQLVEMFKQHVQEYQLDILPAHLEELSYENDLFQFSIPGKNLTSQVAVIATGTKPRRFEDFSLPSEIQDQVFYEVFPLLGVKNKRIAIIGAGDAAFDYAINLAEDNFVMVLNRGDTISCLPLLWERASLIPNIQYHRKTSISKVCSAPNQQLKIDCKTAGIPISFLVDYMVGALGRDPNLDFISGHFAEKAIQLENSGRLYYVGDVANGLYRQTAIAIGNGILAAMKIYRYFKEKDQ